ncbi:hypothetical protein DSO57_1013713 [Entomophthora muscae]|uniref:Uncharacterized protein n=1 Tax=Entomophthora muscae TaxID=34485 RepID=A0ACC2TGI9_9FUNG|nr:hypothetical protein DSO57_1013713 [Entomophthora muscae]
MRGGLLVSIQVVIGIHAGVQEGLASAYNKSLLFYQGDGGDGSVDYVRFIINKSLPYTVKGLAQFHDREPPHKTDLVFQHASIDQIIANFNNTLVSNCPIRWFKRNTCIVKSTYSDVHVFEDKLVDAVAVVLANNKQKKIVVSYRATITTQNWLDDLNAALIDLPGAPVGARVHRGVFINYLASYTNVNSIVTRMLDDPRFKDYSVLVTGYSLGGAVATMALPTIATLVQTHSDPRTIELISYAAPRMANAEYAKYLASFNVPVTRVTLAYDAVSHLPLRKMGYTHAGVEIHVDQPSLTGNYSLRLCSQEYDEDPSCAWAENSELNGVRHGTPFGTFLPRPPYS